MFKELINESKIMFRLKAEGPLLIRSGEVMELDPVLPSDSFIRSFHDGDYSVVIPGSSIKGVFRNRLEKTFGNCCNIFDKTCSSKVKNESLGKGRYKGSCGACKIFGNLSLKSRIEFRDAFPIKDTVKLTTRYNVGIDRVSGASKHNALFEPEVLEAGEFDVEIILKNFFLWQLKALMQVFNDINEGYVTFGGVSSRGFGKMSTDNIEVTMRQYGIYDSGELFKEKRMKRDELIERLKSIKLSQDEIGRVDIENECIL